MRTGKKGFALLVDPDKSNEDYLDNCLAVSAESDGVFDLRGALGMFRNTAGCRVHPIRSDARIVGDGFCCCFAGCAVRGPGAVQPY